MGVKRTWLEKWSWPSFSDYREKNFETMDSYLGFSPQNILDIGCGLAYESEKFQKKYGTDLYLLDGDAELTIENYRDINYGPVDNFKFYNTIRDLKESWDHRQLKYNFVDANNIKLSQEIKFDLIYSLLSCGFHYPAITYKDLIEKHSTDKTVIIMDFQKSSLEGQLTYIDVIDIISENDTALKIHLKFKKIK